MALRRSGLFAMAQNSPTIAHPNFSGDEKLLFLLRPNFVIKPVYLGYLDDVGKLCWKGEGERCSFQSRHFDPSSQRTSNLRKSEFRRVHMWQPRISFFGAFDQLDPLSPSRHNVSTLGCLLGWLRTRKCGHGGDTWTTLSSSWPTPTTHTVGT